MTEKLLFRYPLAIRVLHWLMAVIIIGLLIVGLIMTSLPKGDPTRALLYNLHKSFGVTILMLALLRVGVRLLEAIPPLPDIIPTTERIAARLGHSALYFFMFAMPISGYMMSNAYGLPVRWFTVELPKLFSSDRARGVLAGNFHSYTGFTLIGVIALHVSGVLWHYMRQKVNLLKRMV